MCLETYTMQNSEDHEIINLILCTFMLTLAEFLNYKINKLHFFQESLFK